jgi:hypothetical protein
MTEHIWPGSPVVGDQSSEVFSLRWEGGGGKWQLPQMWIIVVVIEICAVSRIRALCCLKKRKMNPVELHAY